MVHHVDRPQYSASNGARFGLKGEVLLYNKLRTSNWRTCSQLWTKSSDAHRINPKSKRINEWWPCFGRAKSYLLAHELQLVRGKHEREAQCIFWTIYTNGVNIHHKALSTFSNINYVHTNGLRNQVRRRCRFDHSSHFPWDLLIWLSDRDRAFTNQNYDISTNSTSQSTYKRQTPHRAIAVNWCPKKRWSCNRGGTREHSVKV